MYVNLKTVLEQAERDNFTVGAFNTHNLEMLPSILRAAKHTGMPVIIQTSVATAQYIGYDILVNLIKNFAEKEMVQAALHLDHAKNFDDIKQAIDAGYSSVMFDGSSLPFKENILKTRAVVDYAHARNVSVEGELGTIGGTEEGISVSQENIQFTRPEDALIFVEETGVDALAVAIGTNHGQYRSKTNVNIELLKQINATVSTPLVVHGGTGVKEEDYPNLINNGIRKFNVGTELIVNWNEQVQNLYKDSPLHRSVRDNMIPGNDKVEAVVIHKMGKFMNRKGQMNIK
ncbi:class II fructose-bisphosphate aldolase [Allofustis seminis]|uniref:class II fructose-bisphosphate aldolase n=1 Tax=Allofustis seminis TaxID=166939 RepID=UPI0003A2F0F1|nr:class II fructose-bisphosphate aldolase [Allofustis seminis]